MADPTPGIHPRFFTEAVLDEARTAAEGRNCYRDEERVEIIIAGAAQLNRPVQRVTELHRQRWPDQYAAFRKGLDQTIDGTPLETWPILTKAQVEELKAMRIYSVEDVASLADLACQRIGMGGYGLRDKARAYLDEAAELALLEKTTKRNEELESRMAAQDSQVAELKAICDQLFSEVQSLRSMQSPLAAAVPAHSDPVERAKPIHAVPVIGANPFDQMADAPRRRGRPPKAAAA